MGGRCERSGDCMVKGVRVGGGGGGVGGRRVGRGGVWWGY